VCSCDVAGFLRHGCVHTATRIDTVHWLVRARTHKREQTSIICLYVRIHISVSNVHAHDLYKIVYHVNAHSRERARIRYMCVRYLKQTHAEANST
jgi:hypothetical protein